jgi:hypothetical protein
MLFTRHVFVGHSVKPSPLFLGKHDGAGAGD